MRKEWNSFCSKWTTKNNFVYDIYYIAVNHLTSSWIHSWKCWIVFEMRAQFEGGCKRIRFCWVLESSQHLHQLLFTFGCHRTFVLLVVTINCSPFLFREKKKEKEREELWKQLEKLEIETRNKSTCSASNPAGSNPNPSTSSGAGTATKNAKSWTPERRPRLLFCPDLLRHFD